MQRKLTREEIAQLAEEYQALERWDQARHNAPTLNAIYLLGEPPTISFSSAYIEKVDSGQHILTGEEILQLDKEYQALEQWEHVSQTICYAYEENAYKAIISTIYYYFDEYQPDGGYFVQVLDREGKPVMPDLYTKYWDVECFSPFDEQEWIEIAQNINLNRIFNGIDIADGEYILDSPLPISFSEVYIDEPDLPD